MAIEDTVVVLCPEGALDTTTAPQLDPVVTSLVSGGVTKIILNLSFVKFIGSRGVGHILNWSNLLAERSGKLLLCSVPESSKGVLELVGANRFLTIAKNLKEAMELIRGPRERP